MHFLADENLPAITIDALRSAGVDVASVREDAPGSKDDEVLALARTEARVLLTFDKDFRTVYGFPPRTDKPKGKERRR